MSYALGLGAVAREAAVGADAAVRVHAVRRTGSSSISPALTGFPVAIAHGTLDPVIPVDFSRAARDALAAAGADVTYNESPVGHTIDPQVIPALRGFVAYAIRRAQHSDASTPRVTPGGRWRGRSSRP